MYISSIMDKIITSLGKPPCVRQLYVLCHEESRFIVASSCLDGENFRIEFENAEQVEGCLGDPSSAGSSDILNLTNPTIIDQTLFIGIRVLYKGASLVQISDRKALR